MLIFPNSKFGDKVPIQLGTKVIDTTRRELSNPGNSGREHT